MNRDSYWIMKNGTEIRIKYIPLDHIENILSMLKDNDRRFSLRLKINRKRYIRAMMKEIRLREEE